MKSLFHWLGLCLLLLEALRGQAQQRPTPVYFADDAATRTAAAASPLQARLRAARPLTLAAPALRAALAAPAAVLLLPLPDGRNARFSLRAAPVMAPALAARYPGIRTYAGVGLDDPTATLRLDDTPQGFHAQVLSATTGAVYLDPVSATDPVHYLSYALAAGRAGAAGCVGPASAAATATPAPASAARLTLSPPPATAARLQANASSLRTYRLAVATTDEYTAARGGTVASALAAVVTTVNRVNGFYERELGVRLELVANNDLLIAANSASQPDPFSSNNNATVALTENQAFIEATIGAANYDVGHLFGTNSGGFAEIGALCDSGRKARGESGAGSPGGDSFDIQLVAHEFGHQFGAAHTFNALGAGACTATNREASAACEPGSGSTMMAYPGICGSQNLQGGHDEYFLSLSNAAIRATMASNSCGTTTATGSTLPQVASLGGGKTLPINTPFRLTANAFDAENDVLTYCWEELDAGQGAALGAPQTPGSTEPLFRSLPPALSPTRYFPALANLLANTTSLAEQLPAVTRGLTFFCLVRELHSGPAGVVGGSTLSTRLVLNTTAAAGPFVLTAPNTAVSWAANTTQPVTWDVAGTTANGVDCATVDVWLSADGGLTYPTLLLASAPNNGRAAVVVPNVPTATARLLVAAADNYFFDVSDRNFTITAAPGGPALSSLSPASQAVGGQITLTGTNLAGTTEVRFGTVLAAFAGATAGRVVATVPPGAGNGPVTVRTAAGSSNGLAFGVRPGIGSFSPTSGIATGYGLTGDTMRIATTGAQALVAVEFNGVSAPGFAVNAAGTQATAVVPDGATTGPISLVASTGRVTSTASFTVLPPPCFAVTSLRVSGINASAATVSFAYSLGVWDANELVTVPATAVYPNFQPGDVISGLSANTLYTVIVTTNCPITNETRSVSTSFVTPPGPLNDECATATLLLAGAPGAACQVTGGTLAGATESQPPIWCSGRLGASARDVWYQFVATNPVHTVAVTSQFDGVLEVFAGSCGSLNSLACSDVSATSRGERLTVLDLVPGDMYWLRYYAKARVYGNYDLTPCISTPLPPDGTCPAATNLSVSNITSTSAQLNFTGAAGVSYRVTLTPTAGYNLVTASPLQLNGLRPSYRYVVTVTAECAGGGTVAARTAFVTLAPDLVVSTVANVPSRDYRNLTVTGTGEAGLQGPIRVEGALRVQTPGTLSAYCYPITGPGSFTTEPGTSLYVCHPQGISQSGPTGAVQVTGPRLFGRNGSYYYTLNAAGETGTGLPDTVRTLYVSDVGTGHPMQLTRRVAVREALVLDGADLLLGSADLLLRSDAHRTAYVVNAAGRVQTTGTGRATMQRFVSPTTAYAGPGYRHYSAPVRGVPVSALAVPGRFAPLPNPAYNALPTPALPSAQFPNVFRYAESRLTAAFPDFDAGWESPAGLADSLLPGRGYALNIAPAATVALSGRLNTGDLNTGPLGRAPGPNGGWHLLGNPYPSALYFGSGVTDSLPAGLAHAVYVFEPSSQYGGFYRAFVNGISTDGTPCSLPAMQGFFMRATQPVPGGFTFRDSFRDYSGAGSSSFHRGAAGTRPGRPALLPRHHAAPTWPTLRLALSGPTPAAGPPDFLAIYLAPGARAAGPDPDFDAAKLPNPGAGFGLAARMAGPGNDDDLAINALPPLTAAAPTHRIPLVLSAAAPGTYRFTVSHQHFGPTHTLRLLDHATGSSTDLRRQANYSFTVPQAGQLVGRFEVLLGTANALAASAESVATPFSVSPNPVGRAASLRVSLDKPTAAATATLRTLLGQTVAQRTFDGNGTALATNGLAAGVYLLTVQAAGQAPVTQRVVVE